MDRRRRPTSNQVVRTTIATLADKSARLAPSPLEPEALAAGPCRIGCAAAVGARVAAHAGVAIDPGAVAVLCAHQELVSRHWDNTHGVVRREPRLPRRIATVALPWRASLSAALLVARGAIADKLGPTTTSRANVAAALQVRPRTSRLPVFLLVVTAPLERPPDGLPVASPARPLRIRFATAVGAVVVVHACVAVHPGAVASWSVHQCLIGHHWEHAHGLARRQARLASGEAPVAGPWNPTLAAANWVARGTA